MEALQIVSDISWGAVLTPLIGAYALSVAVFLIMENRSPQSTFAWLLLLLLFPLGGVLIYMMFGRTRHAFSREGTLTKLMEGTSLADRTARVIAEQPAKLAALAEARADYGRVRRPLWAAA